MDFENMSECVNSKQALSQSGETLGKVFNIPNEKYSYNADVICDTSDKTKIKKNNVDLLISDQISPFHNRIHQTKSVPIEHEQNSSAEKQEQADNKCNIQRLLYFESKELDRNLVINNELTDAHFLNNLEHLNDCNDSRSKFGSGIEDEPSILLKESHSSLLIKNKLTDTYSPDSMDHLNDSSDSKGRLSNDSFVEEEQGAKTFSESSGNSHSCNQGTRRTRRNSKRKRADGDECCPVCGVTVRLPELEVHFAKEVENLAKIQKSLKKPLRDERGISTTFVQVKSNRENRLSAKVAQYAARDKTEVQCPVCHLRIRATQQEVNRHVLNCINEEENSDELVVVDDDDEDSFEEYEFADQTRVRAISFVPGGYKSLHGQSSRHKTTDEDEDLDVDVDDTMTYGKPQYTEMDVIHTNLTVTENKELEQLRKAVLLDPTVQPQVLETRKWLNDHGSGQESKVSEQTNNDFSAEPDVLTKRETTEANENLGVKQSDHVVSSLKEKIRDLEELSRNVKCLICLEPYTKPVVSTTCWHVHCEECWLMTMGVKKLCPQCNMIVFPSDLRRIYL